MEKENAIRLFNSTKIRVHWDEEKEKWYFSIVDVLAVLTDSADPQAYWRKLKQRLKEEGNETVTNCHGLKMQAADGKMRMTDVADTEQLLRLIQSVPSPKAEPFKMWLAKVGNERIDETQDPELTFDRAMETYLKKGYSKEWINQRLKSIEVRKELTDEWENRGVKKGEEYAILNPLTGNGMQPYKNTIPNAVHICMKVPTAGGKTFIACNALHTIFSDYLYFMVLTKSRLKLPTHWIKQRNLSDNYEGLKLIPISGESEH